MQWHQSLDGLDETIDAKNLRADVRVQPKKVQLGMRSNLGDQFRNIRNCDSKLLVFSRSGQILVCESVDARVNSDTHVLNLVLSTSNRCDSFDLDF